MTIMIAIVRNGRLELPRPIDLPDGTEVEIRLSESGDPGQADEGPMTPEEVARTLAAMEKVEPFEMSDEERTAWAEASGAASARRCRPAPRNG